MPTRFQPARGSAVLGAIARGPTGLAATIEVGSTSTSAAGSSATVTNTGSTSAASLAFSIPRGADAGIKWLYDATTSMADPGSGDIRFNNATLSSVTAIAVSATGSGSDVSDFVAAWDNSTNPTPAYIMIREEAGAVAAIFSLSAVTDNTDWLQLTVTYVSGSLSLTAADPLYVTPLLIGNEGNDGEVAGPGSSVDMEIALFDGITGATLERATGSGLVVANSGVYTGPRTLTGTANQITVTNGSGTAGNPTISLPADVIVPTVITAPNTGLHILDTNASHDLIIAPGSDLTADHTLTLTTGDADRTVTISGNATISQDYSSTGSPTFATPTVTGLNVGSTSTTLTESAAGIVAVEGTPLLKAGKQTIWIPASAMWARTTNGPGAASRELTTGGDIMIKGLAFDTTTEEAAQFYIAFPKSWDKGTITFRAHWTNVNGLTTETVSWGLSAGAFTDSDAIDSTDLGTEVRVSDTWLAANDLHVTAESSAVTVGNTPIDADLVIGQIARSVSNDNMTGDAELLGVEIFFTTNAATDV
jgi:hypothetical protein